MLRYTKNNYKLYAHFTQGFRQKITEYFDGYDNLIEYEMGSQKDKIRYEKVLKHVKEERKVQQCFVCRRDRPQT